MEHLPPAGYVYPMRALITERFAAPLSGSPEGGAGDYTLNPDMPKRPQALIPSAVLVPLVDRPGGMTVILTQRADTLPDHAGQISFPGGRVEPDDQGPEATALRETQEEIGLDPSFIQVVGRMADYETGSGFCIVPVVALVREGFSLTPEPAEVVEVFEVPLAFVLDAANHVRESALFRGVQRHFFVLPYQDRRIWGATAGLLVQLAHRLGTV